MLRPSCIHVCQRLQPANSIRPNLRGAKGHAICVIVVVFQVLVVLRVLYVLLVADANMAVCQRSRHHSSAEDGTGKATSAAEEGVGEVSLVVGQATGWRSEQPARARLCSNAG